MKHCLFFHKEKYQVALIEEENGSKISVVLQQTSLVIRQNQIIFIWESAVDSSKEAHLVTVEKNIQQASHSIDTNTIFDLCELQTPYSLEELIDLFQTESDPAWYGAALFCAIVNDKIAFRYIKKHFWLRSHEEQEQERQKQKQKQEKEERKAIEKEWAKQLIQGIQPTISEEKKTWWDSFCTQIEYFTIHGSKALNADYLTEIFSLPHQQEHTASIDRLLLSILSVVEKNYSWGKLQVLRTKANLVFPSTAQEEAKNLISKDIWQTPYQVETKDCRDLEVYTVDQKSTQDYDDAIAFKKTETGFRILVFISDVASFVTPDSNLFQLASNSFSSFYSIKETYPMFPAILSENFLSLQEKQDRAVVAFETCFDLNREIIDQSIFRAVIQVKKNLTYDYFETWLDDSENYYSSLYSVCQKLLQTRQDNGAVLFDRKEVKLDITDVDNIQIQEPLEDTKAQTVIQELAILVNTQTAVASADKDYATFFRGQLPYSFREGITPSANPKMEDIIFQPSKIALTPIAHAVLSVPMYVQVSSPIRRFLDLVAQGILFSMLENSIPVYSEAELFSYSEESQIVMKDYRQKEKLLETHWKWKYLAQNQDAIHTIQFIRKQNYSNKSLLSFTKLDLKCLTFIGELKSDIVYQVKITSIDVIEQRIDLELIDNL